MIWRESGGNGRQDMFLPFAGEWMLPIILSQALLLANDEKIKDPSITRPIKKFLLKSS